MIGWPFPGRRERLRRQASRWLAKLSGPHSEQDRTAFERWYRADPDHAEVYERLSAIFGTAAFIQPPLTVRQAEPARGRTPRYALAVAVACAAVALLVAGVLVVRQPLASSGQGMQTEVLAANDDESRVVQLADGSEILLAAGSRLEVLFDASQRRLRLTRGGGRFTVAHDKRPFVVIAQDAQVIARGTQFFVRLGKRQTFVSLIEGRVEVSYPVSPGGGERRIVRLVAGQQLTVPLEAASHTLPTGAASNSTLPAMIELDDLRLDEAIGRITRPGNRAVRLADPRLAELRVTGAFRVGDVEDFARSAAAALGLELETRADGTFWLRPGRGTPLRD